MAIKAAVRVRQSHHSILELAPFRQIGMEAGHFLADTSGNKPSVGLYLGSRLVESLNNNAMHPSCGGLFYTLYSVARRNRVIASVTRCKQSNPISIDYELYRRCQIV